MIYNSNTQDINITYYSFKHIAYEYNIKILTQIKENA